MQFQLQRVVVLPPGICWILYSPMYQKIITYWSYFRHAGCAIGLR